MQILLQKGLPVFFEETKVTQSLVWDKELLLNKVKQIKIKLLSEKFGVLMMPILKCIY